MNRDEAKNILRLYRPGTLDAEDSEIAVALALAGKDPQLSQWLEKQGDRQAEVRRTFRKIQPPAGLLEQIVSEHQAEEKIIHLRQRGWLMAAAAMVALLIGLPFWFRPHFQEAAGFNLYQTQMASVALRGYGMDLTTNNPGLIRDFLTRNHAPADFVVPAALQKAVVAGCAIESWQGRKISMLCFRTGLPLAPGDQSDMWFFVADQSAFQDAPVSSNPQFSQISHLSVAAWQRDGKIYVLGTTAGETALRKFL